MTRHHRLDERGQAGIETIPLGILVFVAGTLLVVNVWSVLDARMTVDSAARDYLRSYTNATHLGEGRADGSAAARRTVVSRGRDDASMTIANPTEVFGPCRPATVTVTLEVPAIRLPFLGTIGTTHVSATETEFVDAYGGAVGPGIDGTVCDA